MVVQEGTGGGRRGWAELRRYHRDGMRKPDLARRMARQAGVSEGEAADRLDHAVHQIVRALRRGQAAVLPGVGKLLPRGAPGERLRGRR